MLNAVTIGSERLFLTIPSFLDNSNLRSILIKSSKYDKNSTLYGGVESRNSIFLVYKCYFMNNRYLYNFFSE